MIVDTLALDELAARLNDPAVEEALMGVAKEKGVVSIISQAIQDNFDKEGPGWKPLKGKTIRYSISKKIVEKFKLKGMRYKDIEKMEAQTRSRNKHATGEEEEVLRRILRKTGLLMRTATTPGYTGSTTSGGKVVSGSNIYRVEGSNVIFGTNLVYARTHNQGRGKIPARPFLVLRPEWLEDLHAFFIARCEHIIKERFGL